MKIFSTFNELQAFIILIISIMLGTVYDEKKKEKKSLTEIQSHFAFFCLFFVFLPFLGPLPRHMEGSRLRVESDL